MSTRICFENSPILTETPQNSEIVNSKCSIFISLLPFYAISRKKNIFFDKKNTIYLSNFVK